MQDYEIIANKYESGKWIFINHLTIKQIFENRLTLTDESICPLEDAAEHIKKKCVTKNGSYYEFIEKKKFKKNKLKL